jgi:hypothetical protein
VNSGCCDQNEIQEVRMAVKPENGRSSGPLMHSAHQLRITSDFCAALRFSENERDRRPVVAVEAVDALTGEGQAGQARGTDQVPLDAP